MVSMAVNEEKIIRIIGNFEFARNTINSFDWWYAYWRAESVSAHTVPASIYIKHTHTQYNDELWQSFRLLCKMIFVDEIVNALL